MRVIDFFVVELGCRRVVTKLLRVGFSLVSIEIAINVTEALARVFSRISSDFSMGWNNEDLDTIDLLLSMKFFS